MLQQLYKAGIWEAGGTPVEFNNFAQCPNIAEGHHGIRFDTPTRDLVAACIEAFANLHSVDGLVLVGTCDKIIPAYLLAAARLAIIKDLAVLAVFGAISWLVALVFFRIRGDAR